jgi:hypothetical protein
MIKITEDERKILEPLIPDLNELISADSRIDFLLALDNLIIDNLTEDQNLLTPFGLTLQRMYDDIFYRDENMKSAGSEV